MTGKTRNLIRLVVVALLATAIWRYSLWRNHQPDKTRRGQFSMQVDGPPLPLEEVDTPEPTCIKNLLSINMAMVHWSMSHSNDFPCGVSTNMGGVSELCQVDNSGFVINPAQVFGLLTNAEEVSIPSVLVCPQDRSKKPAATLGASKPENITYRIRGGTNVSRAHPKEVLIVCPIEGNTLTCGGTVIPGRKR